MLEIDVEHCGVEQAICVHVDPEGGWMVDTGPESTVETLLAKLPEGWAPQRILLTHIHFDHAGATGRLLELFPDAEVWVHEVGAKHLIDPTRLVASATQIYGDRFDELWGEVMPVPEGNVRILTGGESIDGFEVAYTPGHARHHVAYLKDGVAYCGDVAGVKVHAGPVFPPTPPPDIDVDQWLASIRLLEGWDADALALTHFGRVTDPAPHLVELRETLTTFAELARTLEAGAFADAVRSYIEERTEDPVTRRAYEQANPPSTLHAGLARYWSKRA